MPIRSTPKSKRLAAQTAELALAIPQVIAHRTIRMAAAGASPSVRDRQEFHTMGAEKLFAFGESWNAMAIEACLANQRMALSLMQSFWFPWLPRASASKQLTDATLGVLSKGMAPYHRSVTANAKRLGRPKRRRR